MQCERYMVGSSGERCGNKASWYFNYKYLDRMCSCRSRECIVNRHATEGKTALCEACHSYDMNRGAHPYPDNVVPVEQQFTRIEE